MSYCVYVLYSRALERYYVGFSADADRRLREHRRGQSAWTSGTKDWIKVFSQTVVTAEDARLLEKRIKARGARRFLEAKLC